MVDGIAIDVLSLEVPSLKLVLCCAWYLYDIVVFIAGETYIVNAFLFFTSMFFFLDMIWTLLLSNDKRLYEQCTLQICD